MKWWKKSKKEKNPDIKITHNNILLDMDPMIVELFRKRNLDELNKRIEEESKKRKI